MQKRCWSLSGSTTIYRAWEVARAKGDTKWDQTSDTFRWGMYDVTIAEEESVRTMPRASWLSILTLGRECVRVRMWKLQRVFLWRRQSENANRYSSARIFCRYFLNDVFDARKKRRRHRLTNL